jgi:hypothetical protein
MTDNWYFNWQLAQTHAAELRDSMQRYRLTKKQTRRVGWPRRLAFALALLGMR